MSPQAGSNNRSGSRGGSHGGAAGNQQNGSLHGRTASVSSSQGRRSPHAGTFPSGSAPGGFAPINYVAADPFTGHDYSLSLPHSPAGSSPHMQYPSGHMRRSSHGKVEIQPAYEHALRPPQHAELSPQAGSPEVDRRASPSPDMTAASSSPQAPSPSAGGTPQAYPPSPATSPGGAVGLMAVGGGVEPASPERSATSSTRGRRGQGSGTRKPFADRLQPPLPVSPRPMQRAASSVAADATATDPSAVFSSPNGERAEPARTAAPASRRRQGPPAYLRMDERPISIDGKSTNGISQSQGIPLEADINLAGAASSSFYGSVDGIGLDSGGAAAARISGKDLVQRKMAREFSLSVAQEGVALTQYLGLSLQRCASAPAAPAGRPGALFMRCLYSASTEVSPGTLEEANAELASNSP